jgi:hypothetical protein
LRRKVDRFRIWKKLPIWRKLLIHLS